MATFLTRRLVPFQRQACLAFGSAYTHTKQRRVHADLSTAQQSFTFQAGRPVGSKKFSTHAVPLDIAAEAEDISWEDILPVSKLKSETFKAELERSEDTDVIAGAERETGNETCLLLDRVIESSVTDKITSYLSALGIKRSKGKHLAGVFGLEFTSFARNIRLLCTAGLTELEACEVALIFSVLELPKTSADCVRILRNDGISLSRLTKNDRQATITILSMKPSQLIRNIKMLKDSGLEAKDIEKLKWIFVLRPLEKAVLKRIKSLQSCSLSGEHLQSMLSSALVTGATMCSAEEAPSLVKLSALIKELELHPSFNGIPALHAADMDKLRLNVMELTGSPLFMMPKLVGTLLLKSASRDILLNSNQEDLRRHIQSLLVLSDYRSVANVLQFKLRAHPLLLNPGLDIEQRSRELKQLFPNRMIQLIFLKHTYMFLLSVEEISNRIRICKDVPGLTTEKMLQIGVFKRPLLRLESAVEAVKDMQAASAQETLEMYLSGQAMPVIGRKY